jgi:hypothetical protein
VPVELRARRSERRLDVEGFPLVLSWFFVYPARRQVSVAARGFMEFVRREAGPLLLDRRESAAT